jgi:hypothetical protein
MEEHQRNQTSPIEVECPPLDHLPLKMGIQHDATLRKHRSPLRLLIITIAAIFVAEIVAMIVVSGLQWLPYYQITLVDAGIMMILIFPVLYLFSFHPLIRQMDKSWQAEKSLLPHSLPERLSVPLPDPGLQQYPRRGSLADRQRGRLPGCTCQHHCGPW